MRGLYLSDVPSDGDESIGDKEHKDDERERSEPPSFTCDCPSLS
jgi:hypothetical protein